MDNMTDTPDPRAALRARLLDMQAGLVETMLRDGYSAGLGTMLAGINAALAALDATTTRQKMAR
jgi:hypothetical protein